MFETEKLIYLQLQKTGSTHIAKLLRENVGGSLVKKHESLSERETKKYVIGSIRSPYEWYVSLWAHGCRGRGNLVSNLNKRFHFGYLLRKLTSNPGKIGLVFQSIMSSITKPTSVWRDVYSDVNDSENFKRWLKLLLDPARRFDMCENYAEVCGKSEFGYMTHRYLKVYTTKGAWTGFKGGRYESLLEFDKSENLVDSFIRVENLEGDFLVALQDAGYRTDTTLGNAVTKSEKTNQSPHREASDYYDDELRTIILEKEKLIFEKHYPESINE